MKRYGLVLLAAWFTSGFAWSADAPKQLTPEERIQYAKLAKEESELAMRRAILEELSKEHTARAEIAREKNAEKSRWENDLAQELRTQAMALLDQLNEVTKRKLALAGPQAPAGPDLLPQSGPEETVFVLKLDEALLKTRQDLAALFQKEKMLHLELLTNNTPEAVARISTVLQDNSWQAYQLEQRQTDLELKKLEFRALTK
jgi:hypothetical protein